MNIPNRVVTFLKRARTSRIDPARDWLALMTLFVIAFAGLVVWNMWAFDTIANGGVVGRSATSTSALVDQSALEAAHTIFEKRAVEEKKYLSGEYRFADPSQ